MELTRNLHLRPTAEVIVRAMVQLCASLNITVIAEGIETVEEYDRVRECGIQLIQGYLLAKPSFECLPAFTLPEASGHTPTLISPVKAPLLPLLVA